MYNGKDTSLECSIIDYHAASIAADEIALYYLLIIQHEECNL